MDQDGTWHGGWPWSRPHCARWGPGPLPKKGAEPPIFGTFLLWPNGWMHQDATWHGGRTRRSDIVTWGRSSIREKIQQSRVHRNLASFQEWPLVPLILSSRVNSSFSLILDKHWMSTSNELSVSLITLVVPFSRGPAYSGPIRRGLVTTGPLR